MYDVDNHDEIAPSGFAVDSPGKADWAVSKVKEEKARLDMYLVAADEHIATLMKQKQAAKDKFDRDTEFLISQLCDYMETVPSRTTKTQVVVDLPSGKLVRKLPKVDFSRDDNRIIAQLIGTEYVENVPKLKWADLKKTLCPLETGEVINSATGEIVDGITAVETPAVFEIK